MPRYADGEMWDIYDNRPSRKLYTYNEISVEALHCFGWQSFKLIHLIIPPHYHKDCFEFHYIEDGMIKFLVGEESYPVSGGNVFVNFPNELHNAEENPLTTHKMYWFNLRVQPTILGLSEESSQILLDHLKNLNHRIIPADSHMKTALLGAFRYVCSKDSFQQQYAASQMVSFLYRLIEQEASIEKKPVSDEILQAIDYMKEHLTQYVDLSQIAKSIGYSLPYFKAKFKKEIGVSPANFYMGIRIDEAKRMLAEGYSVTETANTLDFCSPNYFSTVFHQITAMTPSHYQKKHHP